MSARATCTARSEYVGINVRAQGVYMQHNKEEGTLIISLLNAPRAFSCLPLHFGKEDHLCNADACDESHMFALQTAWQRLGLAAESLFPHISVYSTP